MKARTFPISGDPHPPKKREPTPSPSRPAHTQGAGELQPFIAGSGRGSRSPRGHTTNLFLVREPLLVAVSAWAW